MKMIREKEIARITEYLVKLLHEEWEHSGKTKAEVVINKADKIIAETRLAEEIQIRQGQLEMEGISFRECMELSRENFVLLRLIKKIKKAGDRAAHRENVTSFTVEMDKEEYKLFSTLIRALEV